MHHAEPARKAALVTVAVRALEDALKPAARS
jgi:hypothetical protein